MVAQAGDIPRDTGAYERAVERIEWVDQHVTMDAVLGLAGIAAGDGDRTACPVCGEDRAFRVHADWAFCFGCDHPWSPVSLYAELRGLRRGKAAGELIAELGLHPERPAAPPPRIEAIYLAEALQAACRDAGPGWSRRCFEPEIAGPFARCLGLLSLVRTEAEARQWLDVSKGVMGAVLARASGEAR